MCGRLISIMNTIGVQRIIDIQHIYNQNFSDYKKVLLKELEYQLSQEIISLLGKLGEKKFLVLLQPTYIENNLPMSQISIALEVKTDICELKPYIITEVRYKDRKVKPIETLTVWQRIRFLFTGEYPE